MYKVQIKLKILFAFLEFDFFYIIFIYIIQNCNCKKKWIIELLILMQLNRYLTSMLEIIEKLIIRSILYFKFKSRRLIPFFIFSNH